MLELKDTELNVVSGGRSGKIPPEGIVLSDYTNVIDGRYYANGEDVAYVYGINPHDVDHTFYNCELEHISYHGDSWSTYKCGIDIIEDREFRKSYPKLLNIRR